jgi:carboxylesterase type B
MTSITPSTKKPSYDGPRFSFPHPQLGLITGRLVDSVEFPGVSVVQFRSIPYATIPKRFLPSVLLTEIPSNFDSRSPRDFTNFGAACPQLGATKPDWCDSYGGPLEDDLYWEFDEMTCLSVTISVPESHLRATQSENRLPVMVYVHGGGAQEGIGHVDGLHSNAPITAYAASISEPVITVNVGYRLNWLGGLVCKDLVDEWTLNPTSPHGPFNLTIQDQRNAFAWIDKFIGGFGGDATNITAFAESAGSILLIYHICGSQARLFDRAILQSGVILGDLPFEVKEMEYQSLLKSLGIRGQTSEERLDGLRKIDADVLAKFPGSHILPFVGQVPGVRMEDSLFTKGPPTVTTQMTLIPACEWLGDIIVGEDFWEGQTAFDSLKHCSQTTFINTVKSLFPEQEGCALLEAYNLPTSGTIDNNRAWMQMSLFLGDMMFSADYNNLSQILASDMPKRRNIYRYSFGLSNPFPGSSCSFTTGHHFVEILYIFLTLLHRYPAHRDNWLRHQATETARRWILFARGKQPWSPYLVSSEGKDDDAVIAICDDIVGWTERTIREDESVSKNDPWGERRYAGWRAFKNAFDSLKIEGEHVNTYSAKVTGAKVELLQLAFGSGRVKTLPPGVEETAKPSELISMCEYT